MTLRPFGSIQPSCLPPDFRKVRPLHIALPISPCYETAVDEDRLVGAMVPDAFEEYSTTE
jgi:hypothetical protein